jgi:hypothetical protein
MAFEIRGLRVGSEVDTAVFTRRVYIDRYLLSYVQRSMVGLIGSQEFLRIL